MLLARRYGIETNVKLFSDHAAYVRNALVWASQGIYSKFEYLERIYFDAMGGKKTIDDPSKATENEYTTISGHYIADQEAQPHQYEEE